MKKKKVRRKRRKKINPWIPRLVLGVSTVLVLVVLLEIVFLARESSFFGYVADLLTSHRMEDYENIASPTYEDLLYLTYLDSLSRDEMALPIEKGGNMPRLVFAQAGLPEEILDSWGFIHTDLRQLYEEMERRGRLKLSGQWGLLKLIKEGEIHMGYIVLAQLHPYTDLDRIDFCGVLTRVNRFNPRVSTVLYRHQGRLVHGKLGEVPRFAYFGSVVPGHDLAGVYRQYLRNRR